MANAPAARPGEFRSGKLGKTRDSHLFLSLAWRTEFNGTVQPTQTAVVTFQYDNRDRPIHETRVVNQTRTVYDLWYTCDGLGNRPEKIEYAGGRLCDARSDGRPSRQQGA